MKNLGSENSMTMKDDNRDKVQYGPVSVISLAHLINDTYSNFLPQFLPFLIAATGMGYARATFLVSVFTLSSSVVQPLLGFIIDKKGKSWLLYVGTLWMTLFLSLMGLFTQYWLLVLLAGLAGIGTAVFHPQATSLMGKISGNRKGAMMSAFMAMGNLGFSLSPLIFIPLLKFTGIQGTVYMLIPGILISLFLIKFTKISDAENKIEREARENPFPALVRARNELSKLVAVVVLRSAAYTGLIALLPNYFKLKGISVLSAGNLMFLMMFSGFLGGIAGGWLSDRIGRKPVTIMSLVLSTPAYFAFFYTEGIISYIFLALAGGLLMGSFSVTVVAAQEIIPANRGLASGISMGLSIGLGGFAITLVGWFADLYGLPNAVQLLFLLPGLAALIGLFRKKRPVYS